MLKAIFYKEYLKVRWFWLTALGLNFLVTADVFVHTRRLFLMDHAEMVWYRSMQLGQLHYEALKYLPLLTGVFIGLAQFLPEMRGERLRLSLHLPLGPHWLVLAHLLVGLTGVASIVGLSALGLAGITSLYFPAEMVVSALNTFLPWALCGWAGYLGAALVLLEPSFRIRVFNLAVSAGVAGLFLIPAWPGAFIPVLPFLLLLLGAAVPTVLWPAYRYRYRSVD